MDLQSAVISTRVWVWLLRVNRGRKEIRVTWFDFGCRLWCLVCFVPQVIVSVGWLDLSLFSLYNATNIEKNVSQNLATMQSCYCRRMSRSTLVQRCQIYLQSCWCHQLIRMLFRCKRRYTIWSPINDNCIKSCGYSLCYLVVTATIAVTKDARKSAAGAVQLIAASNSKVSASSVVLLC